MQLRPNSILGIISRGFLGIIGYVSVYVWVLPSESARALYLMSTAAVFVGLFVAVLLWLLADLETWVRVFYVDAEGRWLLDKWFNRAAFKQADKDGELAPKQTATGHQGYVVKRWKLDLENDNYELEGTWEGNADVDQLVASRAKIEEIYDELEDEAREAISLRALMGHVCRRALADMVQDIQEVTEEAEHPTQAKIQEHVDQVLERFDDLDERAADEEQVTQDKEELEEQAKAEVNGDGEVAAVDVEEVGSA